MSAVSEQQASGNLPESPDSSFSEQQARAARLEAAAQRGNWNPYYLAYALATGAADPATAFERDGNNAAYFRWNGARWRETYSRLGDTVEMPAKRAADHMYTLAGYVTDEMLAAHEPGALFRAAGMS